MGDTGQAPNQEHRAMAGVIGKGSSNKADTYPLLTRSLAACCCQLCLKAHPNQSADAPDEKI